VSTRVIIGENEVGWRIQIRVLALWKKKKRKKCRTEEANPVYRTSPNSTNKCCREKWRKWHGFPLSDL